MNDTLAERLRIARTARSMSQSGLAREVGISPQAIQSLEAGTAQSSKYLMSIAGVLGVRAEWLASGLGEMERDKRASFPPPSLMQTDPDQEDVDLAFPSGTISYNADSVPIFIARAISSLDLPKKTTTEASEQIEWWLSANLQFVDLHQLKHSCSSGFFAIDGIRAEEMWPRPHMLKGQVDAYALYIDSVGIFSDRTGNTEILMVSPYRRPYYGDLVVAWHKSNVFTVSEFEAEDEHSLYIRHKKLYSAFDNEQDFAKALEMPTSFALPISHLKAVHCVVSSEYAVPRSSRIRGHNALRRRRGA